MKSSGTVFAGLLFLVLSIGAKAQDKIDYFAGKWNIVVSGTPGGDAKMIMSLERKEGKLQGVVLDSTQKEISKITNIEETEKSVTLYFNAQGFDVNLLMEKKDDDHVTGNLMNMFEAKGERMKEMKKLTHD